MGLFFNQLHLSLKETLGDSVVLRPEALEQVGEEVLANHHDLVHLRHTFQTCA